MKELKVRITFTEEVLGMMCNDRDVYEEYIASKSPDASTISEEVAAIGVDAVVEKGTTVFPRTANGEPFLYDYQWKGYFKEKCSFMRNIKGSLSEKVKAYKKKIDGNIFVEPRQVVLHTPDENGNCSRPLRASTPQGERVALASSETAAEGTYCDFTIVCMIDSDVELVKEWLDYGKYHGTGQWRNSGKGRFTWEEITE